VVYCAGVTADFRTRPYDTIEAHVSLPARILGNGRFDSFLYLSSTRVYGGAGSGKEEADILVNPRSPSDLYNLSKLSGEALCLSSDHPAVRVARLSNVYGAAMFRPGMDHGNFLASVIIDAAGTRNVELQASANSAKDYIHVDDVTAALALIASTGTERLYNVATGDNVTHSRLLGALSELTGCNWSAPEDAPHQSFPPVSTKRLAALFKAAGQNWAPARLMDRLPELIHAAGNGGHVTEGAIA
jgi:nucleoside-diphosphate-sugar epimerase